MTVLHNLAEHVSDAEKCRSSHLQEKACCWLYNTESPNITLCTSELNEYRILWGQMNKLYVDFTNLFPAMTQEVSQCIRESVDSLCRDETDAPIT